MSHATLRVEGELHLSLEAVAEVYRVQAVWLREVYDCGLLGSGVDAERTVFIHCARLDRVATIVRLHQVLGLDVEDIALELAR